MNLATEIKHIISRELHKEVRTKYAAGGLVIYVLSTIFVCYLSFEQITNASVGNALFWIILLFASVNTVAKSFMSDSEGEQLYLYTLVSPQALITGRMIYNFFLMTALTLVTYVVFTTLMGSFVFNTTLYLLALILGGAGFTFILTMISAIASKSGGGVTLMAVLGFPIVLPVLMTGVHLAELGTMGARLATGGKYILTLVALDLIIMVLGYLLFPYLWRD